MSGADKLQECWRINQALIQTVQNFNDACEEKVLNNDNQKASKKAIDYKLQMIELANKMLKLINSK